MKKIWIFAGEASGDLYGARLGDALRELAGKLGFELTKTGDRACHNLRKKGNV